MDLPLNESINNSRLSRDNKERDLALSPKVLS